MPLYNKNYLDITGTPNVTEETRFQVQVDEDGNQDETWKYRSQPVSTGEWSTFSAETDIAVDTAYQLGSTGIYIKFTRPLRAQYYPGDKWTFSTLPEVKFSPTDGIYKYIETIDIDDDRHLIAVNPSNGDVRTIDGIDGDNPQLSESILNIGGSDETKTLDFEKKNKELYIAKGKDYPPQWLGFCKSNGFDGEGNLELKSFPAFDVLVGADNPQTDVFDSSVVLRGGGGPNITDSKIIVGIKTGMSTAYQGVIVANIPDKQLFNFSTPTMPIMVKRWYGKMHGDYCDGFAVLREPDDPDAHGATIDLWNLNSAGGGTYAGQGANMYNSIHIERPEGQTSADFSNGGGIISYGDFLIVPKISDFDDSSNRWTIVVSRSRSRTANWSDSARANYEWLFQSGELTTASMDTPNLTITDGQLSNITPSLYSKSASHNTGVGGDMYYLQRCIHAGADRSIFVGSTEYTADMPDWVPIHANFYTGRQNQTPVFKHDAKYCLSFAGFNSISGSNGETPLILFTIQTQTPKSRGNSVNWYDARTGIGTISQQYINNGGAYDSESSTGSGWNTECFGPFMHNGASNTTARLFRGANWITYAIPISGSNDGSERQKAFCHMKDSNVNGGYTQKWRQVNGSDFNLPSWLLAGPGEFDASSGTNKGNFHKDDVPSVNPNFGTNGNIVVSTYGDERRRHLLHYVRPGNRKLQTFRWGTETAKPQSMSDTSKPQLFPNDCNINTDTDFDAIDNQTAYAYWNEDDTNSATASGHFGAANVTTNMVKYATLAGSSGSSDDKLSYRMSEHGNIIRLSGTHPQQGAWTTWYPSSTECAFINSVPFGDHNIKGLFKPLFAGQVNAPNTHNSSTTMFNISTPVENGGANTWSGLACKKVFYMASLIYDGYQESPLISTRNSLFNDTDDGINESVQVEIIVNDNFPLSDRVTSIALYRATSTHEDNTEPDTLYRFIQEIPLYQFNHNQVKGHQSFTVTDTGDAESTYEAINGVSEKIYDIALNYTVNTQQNGYHFVSNARHIQIPDCENYLFRSQPGKFSIFDWTKDFCQLPFVPTALKGFMGKVYAFSPNQVAVVNPESLFIEDVIEGVGCINSKTILVTDAGMMWCDYRNIYMGAPSVRPVGDAILNVDLDGWLEIPLENKKDVRCGYDAKRKAFLVFYHRGTTYRCWAYSTLKNRWDLWETPKKVMDTAITKDGSTIMLMEDNRVMKFLASTSQRLDWEWESKRMGLGNTMVDKKVRNLKIESSSRNMTNLYYKLDGDSAWKTGTDISTSFTGTQNRALQLQASDKTKKIHWIKAKITGDNSSAGTDIKAYATSVIYKQKRPK